MNCKYCGAELEADAKFCPECGKAQTEEDVPSAETAAPETAAPETEAPAEEAAQAEEAAPQTDEAAEAAPEAKESPTQEAPAEKPEKSEKKKTGWLLGGAIAVLVIVIALLVVKIVRDSQIKNVDTATTEETVADASTDAADPSDTPDDKLDSSGDGESTEIPLNGVSYTVDAEALTDEVLNLEVAHCGDDRLTNRDLPYYYWQQYYSFASTYSSYAAYLIDTTKPFDQQMCIFDDTLTWQQYFLQGAVSTYKSVSALWQDARLSGFQLGEEDQDYLDGLSNTVTVSAASYGYESADAYLQTAYGPAATMTGYHDFVERYLTASAYLQALVEAKTYTEADISAYFDENADTYAASSIEKSDVNMVNVRHILIVPEEKNDDGTYTDAAWTAAEQKAQSLLDEWKAGEHTEDSFAFLAAENSADTGSASNGGLYEGVYPGQTVDAFDAWCFDAARQPGDTGIVKTDYGYHVMYFSSVCEHPYWYVRAESDYLNKLSADVSEEVSAKFESAESVQNAALADILQN